MKNLKNALLLKQLYQLKQLGYRYTSVTPYKEEEPNLSLPDTLDYLKKQAQECHLCDLSKQRNKVVFGMGNPKATLMIVGDTPSSSDDSTGEIFTGRTGELLTKMIENVLGLRREDVYITNALKCRAIETLNPSTTHLHTCYPYLLKEIALVEPKVVLALGEVAYHMLTQDESPLEKVRGIIQKQENYQLIATYHPNHLLRNPAMKKEVFEDLKRVKGLL